MHSSHIRNELNNGKVFWEFISIYRQRLSQCRSLDEKKVFFSNEIEFTRTASQCTEHTHSVSTATVQATKSEREKKLRKKAYRNQYQCNRVYCSSKCTAQCSNCCCCCLLLSTWRHSILHSWTWCSSGENRIHLNESQSSFARERKNSWESKRHRTQCMYCTIFSHVGVAGAVENEAMIEESEGNALFCSFLFFCALIGKSDQKLIYLINLNSVHLKNSSSRVLSTYKSLRCASFGSNAHLFGMRASEQANERMNKQASKKSTELILNCLH